MPNYKLSYFDGRGRGEPIRWLFAVAKQQFTDNRLPPQDWFKLKPSFTYGQIPELEVDGTKLYQLHAILNYLAREFGLAGKTPLDQAKVNMIALTLDDALFRHTARLVLIYDEQKQKEEIDKYAAETLPFYLKVYEEQLGDNQYFVGNELTYADLVIVCWTELVTSAIGVPVDLSKYPKLAALKTRVEANEGLAQWLATRPRDHEKPTVLIAAEMRRKNAAQNF